MADFPGRWSMSMSGVQSGVASAQERVLLAQGDATSANHLRGVLTKVGYFVVPAQNGAQARYLLQSEDAPGLAVLDWDLPGGGGMQLCRELQQDRKRRSFYILLLTPWNVHNDRVRGLEAGADDCLPKPVDARELQLRLQKGAQTLLERALRESEERFRGAFECAGVGMALISRSGGFLQVNRALCDFLGYSSSELRAMNLCEVTRREELVPCGGWLQRFFEEGHRSGEFEKQLLTQSGSLVWGLLTVSTVLDADDNPTSFVVQIKNITRRKQAEQAVQRNEAFLRAVTENVSDLIMVLNEKLEFVYANPSHGKLLGYVPANLAGRNALELLHPEDRDRARCAALEVRQDGQPRMLEVRMRHRDGSWRHLEAHGGLLRTASGQIEGFTVTARVIDERILAEQKLQAAHAETELFLQSIPSILIGLDRDGIITRWNRSAVRSLGLPAETAMGRAFHACGVRWLHPDVKGEVQRWLQTESVYRCDSLPFECKGERRILGLNVRRIVPFEESEKPWFIITGADVTERKGLEEQLRQAQKMEAIGQLAAGVAHEINTPTQYVSDNIQFLKDSWPALAAIVHAGQELRTAANGTLIAEHRSTFDRVMRDSEVDYLLQEMPNALGQCTEGLQRVSKIVRAIKEFSHPGIEEKRPLDLNKAIETTLTVTRNEWKYVADVESELDRNLPPVTCLAGEINQVMVNLIVNAAHAITEHLGQDPSRKGLIRVSTRQNGKYAEIALSDTGGGIPPEIRARVFEPFFTTKPVGQGTGQGLALAHSVVVNRHQGQLWFDTEVGKGTTFHIRLPLEAGAQS